MAHPYTKVERIRSLLSRARALDLLDRDSDGKEDPAATDTNSVTVVAAEISRACVWIDSKLAGRYPLPFAAITTALTPPLIADIADWLVASYVYGWKAPDGKEAIYWRGRAKDALDGLVSGDMRLVDTTGGLVAMVDPEDSRAPIAYESTGTQWAGVTDADDMEENQTSDDAVPQSRGL